MAPGKGAVGVAALEPGVGSATKAELADSGGLLAMTAARMPTKLAGWSLPSAQTRLVLMALFWLLLTEVLVGISLAVVGPSTTVLVAVLLVAPAALLIRAEHLVLLTLGALFFSRLLVDFGAPSTLNFAHFPLAILALVKLLERPADQESGRLITWLVLSLVLTLSDAHPDLWAPRGQQLATES